MTKFNLCTRSWALAVIALLTAAGENSAYPHAGHSHGQEIVAPAGADAPPRFYAQSNAIEAILTFPPDGRPGDPVLYIASSLDNTPLTDATVTADILSGSKAKLQVASGETSGAYIVRGLGRPQTTVSIALDISKGDLMEILSMDNIILGPTSPGAVMNPSARPTGGENANMGFPRYLVQALVAINGLFVAVASMALILWMKKLSPPRNGNGDSTPSGGKLPLLIIVSVLTLAADRSASGHAGDDHSGDSIASPSGSASLHFMPIDVQFEGDVRTTLAVERILPKSLRALGQVEIRSDRKAVVTPPLEGKLLAGYKNDGRVPVQGEVVNKGDVLLVIEQIIAATERVSLTTDRAQVEAELSQARQELALLTRERERSDRLANIIAAQVVERARANQKIAQDKVNGLTNRLQTLTSALTNNGGGNVRQVSIVSPISGTISQSHAVLGEYVRNDKTLFEIVNVEEVFVGADVFETDLGFLRSAKTARITLEAYPQESFTGILHSIGQEINRETRNAHVLFAVSNPEQKLRGGMFATIEIESGTSRTAVVVPKEAVSSRDGVRYVYKKVGPETFQQQTVTVSEFREHVAVLTDGLKAGDRVAISGLYQIRNSPSLSAPNAAGTAQRSQE